MRKYLVPGVLLLTASLAFANGGPVDWTRTRPSHGLGITPVPNEHISLEREDLRIKVTGYNTYAVHATYTLKNSGPDQTVTFGVPITEIDMEMYDSVHGTDRYKTEQLVQSNDIAKGIAIGFDGTSFTCQPARGAPLAKTLPQGPGWLRPGPGRDVRLWCVASNLNFPAGESRTLVMEYETDLSYMDYIYTTSALTVFDDRRIFYLFAPAGNWAGNAKVVSIEVDPGPYGGLVSVTQPEGYTLEEKKVKWKLTDVDFNKLPALLISFDSVLNHKRELMSWNKQEAAYSRIPATATASSVLKQQGKSTYGPENLLDGEGATAWCEGSPKDGKGEYIEFHIPDKSLFSEPVCRLEGISVTPGYTKNQKVYDINGKVRKVRVSACQGKQYKEFVFALSAPYQLVPEMLENKYISQDKSWDLDFIRKDRCFRITILEIKPGPSGDTCMSEVALVPNCG